jgi:hypothetical protein
VTLKGQSWIATSLVTLGLLGLVAALSMKILRIMVWPSLVLIAVGCIAFIVVVANASRQMEGTSVHVEAMLAEAARLQAMKRGQGGESGKSCDR